MTTRPFVDVVVDDAGARATVSEAHLDALCAGHFPGDPFVPGAYVAGLMADVACRLAGGRGPIEIDRCTFRAPLRPRAGVVVRARPAAGGVIDTAVEVDDRCVARARMRFP